MVCRILSGWKVENKTSDCTYLTVYLLYNAHEKMSTFFLFLCCFNKALNFEPGWDASVEFLPGHWGDIPNITLFLSALHLTRDLMGISMPCGFLVSMWNPSIWQPRSASHYTLKVSVRNRDGNNYYPTALFKCSAQYYIYGTACVCIYIVPVKSWHLSQSRVSLFIKKKNTILHCWIIEKKSKL